LTVRTAIPAVSSARENVPPNWSSRWSVCLGPHCTEPLIKRKVDKLQRSQLADQHLLLLVDESGMDFSPYYAVAVAEDVPTRSPQLPVTLTDLWLASGYRLGGA
jgi:hypothetical protein